MLPTEIHRIKVRTFYAFFTPSGRAFRFGETVPLQNDFSCPTLGYVSGDRWVITGHGNSKDSYFVSAKNVPDEGEKFIFFFQTEEAVILMVWLPFMAKPVVKVSRVGASESLLCFSLQLAEALFPDDYDFRDAVLTLFRRAQVLPDPVSPGSGGNACTPVVPKQNPVINEGER